MARTVTGVVRIATIPLLIWLFRNSSEPPGPAALGWTFLILKKKTVTSPLGQGGTSGGFIRWSASITDLPRSQVASGSAAKRPRLNTRYFAFNSFNALFASAWLGFCCRAVRNSAIASAFRFASQRARPY